MSPAEPSRGGALALLSLCVAIGLALGLPRLQIVGEMWRLLPETPDTIGPDDLLARFGADPPVFGWIRTADGEPNPTALVEAIGRADATLRADPRVRGLTAGIDNETAAKAAAALAPWLPLMLEAGDPRWRRPDAMEEAVAGARQRLMLPSNVEQRAAMLADPYDWMTASFATIFQGGGGFDITTRDGRLLSPALNAALLLASPSPGSGGIADLAASVRQAMEQASAADPEARLVGGLAGPGALAADGERQIRADLQGSIVLSSALLILLFLVVFRRFTAPLWLMLPAGLATAAGLGAAGWLASPIHGVAIAFGAALLGLCVDFPLHALVTAVHERDEGRSVPEAWRAAASTLARPAVACALSSILGFLLLLQASSPLLAQLGLLGIPSLLLALALGVVVLPAVAAVVRLAPPRRDPPPSPEPPEPSSDRGVGRLEWATAALLLALACGLPSLQLDGEISSLQQPSEEAQLEVAAFDGVFGAAKVPILLGVFGPDSVSVQDSMLRTAQSLRTLGDGGPDFVGALPDLVPAPSVLAERCRQLAAVDLGAWRAAMGGVAQEAGFAPGVFASFFTGLEETLAGPCAAPTPDFLPAFMAATEAFSVIGRRYLRSGEGDAIGLLYLFPRESLEAVPAAWRDSVAGEQVLWALAPELGAQTAAALARDVALLGGIGMVLCLAMLTFVLGSFRSALVALTPPALAMICAGGFFGWLNVAGYTLPAVGLGSVLLILGLGVDDGIYVVHAMQGGARRMRPVRRAILLTTITSLLGFGALAIAQSPALRALGQVACVGLTLDLVVALVIVPALVRRRA